MFQMFYKILANVDVVHIYTTRKATINGFARKRARRQHRNSISQSVHLLGGAITAPRLFLLLPLSLHILRPFLLWGRRGRWQSVCEVLLYGIKRIGFEGRMP